MIQLHQLYPTNYVAEKERFFLDKTYNPQFNLPHQFTLDELTVYGKPSDTLIGLSEAIVHIHSPYQLMNEVMRESEVRLSEPLIENMIQNYLSKYGLASRYTISWRENSISRCSIRENEIFIRRGADYTRLTLSAVLNHEVGTHALRSINDEQQPWHGAEKKLGFSNALLTDEGLAIIHQLIEQNTPIAYSSAIRYQAVAYALEHSFTEVWQFLIPFIRNPEKRWLVCFRVKRGLSDTSQPGGYTKDLVYFAGLVEVARWLSTHDYDPTPLYYGKIGIQDIKLAESLKPTYDILLPHFFTHDREEYASQVQRIIDLNLLEEKLL